jgi:hypothetical protein
MADYLTFRFTDGSSVSLQAFPVTPDAGATTAAGAEEDEDRPAGLGGSLPVARLPRQVSEFGHKALRDALSPLVPLLQEIHDCVAAVPDAPQQVQVELGVRLGADLKLGIVGGASSDVTLKISATWQQASGIGANASGG